MRRFYLCFIVCLFAGCSQIETTPTLDVDESSLIKQDLRIDKGTNPITAEQAVNVALLFNSSQPQTKAKGSKEVENVYTISGNDGQPAMYAVNYCGGKGFTLVGASRKYYPILAFVEYGHFDDSFVNYGLSEWVDTQLKIISDINCDSLTFNNEGLFDSLWSEYEKKGLDLNGTKSESDAFNLRASSVAAWQAMGYTCYDLRECPAELPSSTYASWCSIAQSQAHPDYNYEDYSIILERCVIDSVKVGPIIGTKWDQSDGYNSAVPFFYQNGDRVFLGCVPVAVGQIMRYFEKPSNISWNLYPLTSPNSHVANFLYLLGCRLGIDYASGITSTTDSAAKSVLQNYYNYSLSAGAFNFNTVKQNIIAGKPVYIGGYQGGYGHAWVCEGYMLTTRHYEYELKVISVVEPPLQYENAGSTTTYGSDSVNWLYHNLGYGGWQDGWYVGSNFSNLEGYFSTQTMLYNITPPSY